MVTVFPPLALSARTGNETVIVSPYFSLLAVTVQELPLVVTLALAPLKVGVPSSVKPEGIVSLMTTLDPVALELVCETVTL